MHIFRLWEENKSTQQKPKHRFSQLADLNLGPSGITDHSTIVLPTGFIVHSKK
ncbi:hypothetical protein EXN66_Car017267 [Channa argus]|uniref:Uncharacterized protein n=1 Tax=Channa argus TaxID=215402 RepID=A0A6G1QGR0_CHAAH|nr:hypothetical protein EXN66_Car017267 [Channa argus]